MNDSTDSDAHAFVILDFKGDNLDPARLIALIPLKPGLPRRKGEPLSKTKGAKTAVAITGYCSFNSMNQGLADSANAHLEFILEIVEQRIDGIRALMSEQDLTWQATLFEGETEGAYFSDVDAELRRRMANLGLPLVLPEGQLARQKPTAGLENPPNLR